MGTTVDQENGAEGPWWAWTAFGVVTVATLAGAPVMGRLRDALLERFPGTALKGLAVVLAATLGIALLGSVSAALRRPDSRTWSRWLWMVVALVALGIQLLGFRTSSLQVDIVEKVHIVQYGLLAFLAATALSRSAADRRRLGIEQIWLPICLGTWVGVADESVQGFFQLRTGDIRDVGLNVLASLTGTCFAVAVGRWTWLELRPRPSDRPRLAWITSLAVSAVALFFYHAHLGYVIRDPELGQFHSWFNAQRLVELTEQRRAVWRVDPPTGLKAWAKQDYYLTEAAWHANHRNERFQAADYTSAWQANRILEKHYEPFLDLESFRGAGKHRWDPELKAEVAGKAQPLDPAEYLSPVLRFRIYPWPKSTFVGIWLGAVAMILWLGYRGAGPQRPKFRPKEDAAAEAA